MPGRLVSLYRYLRGKKVGIVSHRSSRSWETFSLLYVEYQQVPVVLVGNKVDLEDEREVSPSEGQALAEDWGCPFMETSAKSKTMVDELFAEIVRQMDFCPLPDRRETCCPPCFASTAAALRPSTAEVRSQRNAVFSREQARQRALYPRIEKIEVSMMGPGLDGTLLIMNKGMSTPLSCARHLTEHHMSNSVLAIVDGEPWPLHQPLTHSCTLTLLTFKDSDPSLVNQAYWRSCAALLGQVLETAFKDDYTVELLSTPEVPGAFCCDVVFDPRLDSWTPSEESLRSLTQGAQQLIHQNLAWEPLEVAPSVALEVFSHSSGGPLVARTGLCSQYEVTALHSLGKGPWGHHRRAQGLSLPLQLQGYVLFVCAHVPACHVSAFFLQAHHTVWRRLRQRAEKLVRTITSRFSTSDSHSIKAAALKPADRSLLVF
ncbi:hypothetical protein GOODEAATRI_000089 [Goodea atripinnis]|uniref:Mitochondrial GTPase 1 n=1 Tax=Goodea atripinnis TaxID=208336 RepID=A0ABV0NGA6_9TELE